MINKDTVKTVKKTRLFLILQKQNILFKNKRKSI